MVIVTKIAKLISTLVFGLILLVAGLFVAGHFKLINFYQPFVVLSGSMEPLIPTGSVVLVLNKTFGYSVGDVITFSLSKDTVVTHRVHALEPEGLDLVYRTQGDANKDPDPNPVSRDQVIGAVTYTIPYLGYLVKFAQTPKGFIFLVIVPGTIIIYEEIQNLRRELAKTMAQLLSKSSVRHIPLLTTPHKTHKPKSWLLIVPVMGVALVVTTLTAAYFTDQEQSRQNVLSASDTWSPATAPLKAFSFGEILEPNQDTKSSLATESAIPTATTSAGENP